MSTKKVPIPYKIHPLFEIPEGAIDLEYEADEFDDEFEDSGDDLPSDETDTAVEGDDVLDTPTGFTVIQQVVRYGPDGGQIIDLIIETEDMDGVVAFEVRKTKV